MTKEMKTTQEIQTPKISNDYKEFLAHLGIDPEDFDYEFDIEMDDYAN